MLTRAGGVPLSLSKFCSAMKPPKFVVSVQEANTIAALGAAALDHSASMMASLSSPPFTPGSMQLVDPVRGAGWTCVKDPAV